MRIAKYQGAEFHDGDESRQVHDFLVGVSTVDDTRKVEQLGALVYLCPEPFLEPFLCISLHADFVNQVKMCQDPNDFGKSMGLKDIQELKGFLRFKR